MNTRLLIRDNDDIDDTIIIEAKILTQKIVEGKGNEPELLVACVITGGKCPDYFGDIRIFKVDAVSNLIDHDAFDLGSIKDYQYDAMYTVTIEEALSDE
jgi:hypothetical protein